MILFLLILLACGNNTDEKSEIKKSLPKKLERTNVKNLFKNKKIKIAFSEKKLDDLPIMSKRMLEAFKTDNYKKVLRYIDEGEDANSAFPKGTKFGLSNPRTPLHRANSIKDYNFAMKLINKGADLTIMHLNDDRHLLRSFIRSDNEGALNIFKIFMANITKEQKNKVSSWKAKKFGTLLHTAAENQKLGVHFVRELLNGMGREEKTKYKMIVENEYKESPLHYAAAEINKEVVKELLKDMSEAKAKEYKLLLTYENENVLHKVALGAFLENEQSGIDIVEFIFQDLIVNEKNILKEQKNNYGKTPYNLAIDNQLNKLAEKLAIVK